jgi:hypothetical protein
MFREKRSGFGGPVASVLMSLREAAPIRVMSHQRQVHFAVIPPKGSLMEFIGETLVRRDVLTG